MSCLAKLPAHSIQARYKHKECERGREHVAVLQWVNYVIRHVKQDTGRVHEHVPAVPAQLPAQINRKAA